jgi:DNA-cytosine methyltransferase
MKYISLFSGIGGFEIAIHNIFPNSFCIGYSEIDKFAIQVYQHHFPTHINLGDIVNITEEQIKLLIKKNKGCDLLVGGFPCQNLTSLSRQNEYCNSEGLHGPKSGLFWNMIQIINWVNKYNPKKKKLHILIENNGSMTNKNKEIITEELSLCFSSKVYMTLLNSAQFGVQTRRRLYWTTFEIDISNIKCEQTWNDVLLPVKEVDKHKLTDKHLLGSCSAKYERKANNIIKLIKLDNNCWSFIKEDSNNLVTKWQLGYHSDTGNDKNIPYRYNYGKCVPITRNLNFSNCLIDRRISKKGDKFIVRYFSAVEVERLFWLPEGWVSKLCSKTRAQKLLGNTVVVKVIEFIIKNLN